MNGFEFSWGLRWMVILVAIKCKAFSAGEAIVDNSKYSFFLLYISLLNLKKKLFSLNLIFQLFLVKKNSMIFFQWILLLSHYTLKLREN